MRGGTRRKARRRYSADEVSRCGRWMKRAGGVALFPEARDERMRRLPSSRGCQARLCFGPLNRRKTRSVLRGEAEGRAESPQKQGFETKPQFRRAEPSGTFENETSRAGLRPEGVYVYAERSQGRANRPFLKGEHGCPKQSRTLEGKPARRHHGTAQKTPKEDIQKSAKIGKILTTGEGGKMV